MIIKNLLLAYNSRILSSPISSFGELCDCGTWIEDAINNGQLEKGESKLPIKKTYGGGVTTSKAPNLMNVSVIIPQQTLAYPSFGKTFHREFFNLGMTLAQAYENLTSKGFVKPLDLIDNRTLPNPNVITKPNIRKNPLPNYHRAPPPYQNWVQIDEIE